MIHKIEVLKWDDDEGDHIGVFRDMELIARWPLQTRPTHDQVILLQALWETQDEAERKDSFDEATVRRELRLYDA